MKRFYALFLLVAACGAKTPDPSAADRTEQACQRALASLRAAKAAGVPCSLARQEVLETEPLCPLEFVCPDERSK